MRRERRSHRSPGLPRVADSTEGIVLTVNGIVADAPPNTSSNGSIAMTPPIIDHETVPGPDANQPTLDPDQASVAALVTSAAEGNKSAWEQLVTRFGGLIESVGWRHGLSAADRNELQQTTWLRLVENIERIRQPERIGGWLATTARRESLQIIRRAGKYTTGADTLLETLPNTNEPEPDTGPIAEEQAAAVQAAWRRLKPRCRDLLSLLITDDAMAYRDLSELLNMPIGSIGPTRARCLEHLRHLVIEEGIISV
jgi:RNA polymerase sigma factor (sigma-70 family)